MTRMSGLVLFDLFQDFRPVTIGQGRNPGSPLRDSHEGQQRNRGGDSRSFDFVFRVERKGNAGAWSRTRASSSTMNTLKG